MSDKARFMTLVVSGKVGPDDIDDYIDRWHSAPVGDLHQFLGIEWDEYAL